MIYLKVAEVSFGARQEAAVAALREMRVVTRKYFDNNSWRRKVKVCITSILFYPIKKFTWYQVPWIGRCDSGDLQTRFI
jgi:hypothetical protein